MPILALLADPLIYAAGGIGAFFGAELHQKINGTTVISASDVHAQSVDWGKVFLYTGAAVVIALGVKKVIGK